MLQMLKTAGARAIKVVFAMVKFLFKLCIAVLKAALIATMFSALVFGGLSAFLAVGPMHTPPWMTPAWNVLNTIDPKRLTDALDGAPSPLWEVRDFSLIVSRWMVQFDPVADLLATAAGVAQEHWLRAEVKLAIQRVSSLVQTEPRFGQALCSFWITSAVSIMYLMVKTFLATVMMLGRCLRRFVRAVCPARAATSEEAAAEMVLPHGAVKLPVVEVTKASNALGENTRVNIVAETLMTSEKKGGRRRHESPHVKTTKVNKEDVPPSPVRRKQSELTELRQQGLVGKRLRGN